MSNYCVVTTSRADYGLLKNLMKTIEDSTSSELSVCVSGSHLDEDHGNTYQAIESDGFEIAAKVKLRLGGDNLAMALAISEAVGKFANYFAESKPDAIIVLGDRFEVFAAATAAYSLKIPIIHLHGGEVTSGALDEAFRHSISKMATLHFTSHEEYSKRLSRMGESPDRIITSGAPGLDLLSNAKIFSKEELEEFIKLKLVDPFFLLTYHPSTLDGADNIAVLKNIIETAKQHGADILATKANIDPEGQDINDYLQDNGVKLVPSLGDYYFSAISHAELVIGNSSSGIYEAPYLNAPTVNIGSRQNGRIIPSSVISCAAEPAEIENAINQAMEGSFGYEHIYGTPGEISKNIFAEIESRNIEQMVYKEFYDG